MSVSVQAVSVHENVATILLSVTSDCETEAPFFDELVQFDVIPFVDVEPVVLLLTVYEPLPDESPCPDCVADPEPVSLTAQPVGFSVPYPALIVFSS